MFNDRCYFNPFPLREKQLQFKMIIGFARRVHIHQLIYEHNWNDNNKFLMFDLFRINV